MRTTTRNHTGKAAVCMVAALATTMAMVPGAAYAHVAQGAVATLDLAASAANAPATTSGVFGTCAWDIDGDGILTIAPAEGSTGQLAASVDANHNGLAPWASNTSVKRVVVKKGVVANKQSGYLFAGLSNCTSMNLCDLDSSKVTDMSHMFEGCSALKDIVVGEGWSTSAVTESADMFKDAVSLPGYDADSLDASRAYAGIKGGCPGYLDDAANYLGGTSGINWSLDDGKWKNTSCWSTYTGKVNCKIRVVSCKTVTNKNGSHTVTVKWQAKQNFKPTKKQAHKYVKAENKTTSLVISAYDYTTGLVATRHFGAKLKASIDKMKYGKVVKDAHGCKFKPWKKMTQTLIYKLPASYKGTLCVGTGGLSKKTLANVYDIPERPFGSLGLAKGAKWYFSNGINLGIM